MAAHELRFSSRFVIALTLTTACAIDAGDPDVAPAPPIDPPPGSFQPLGPSAAYAWHVARSPVDANTLFVGMDDGGGVWRSEDGGGSFSLVTEELPDVLAWAFAIDPRDAARVYAGDAHGRGVFLSRDGGSTWSFSNTGLDRFEQREVTALAVDPIDSDTIWAATLAGVHVSRDAGASWQPVSGPLGSISALAIAVTANNGASEIIVATGQQDETDPVAASSVYRSLDSGATFQDLTPALVAAGALPSGETLAAKVTDVEIDARGRAIVALGMTEDGSPGQVFRSTGANSFEALGVEVSSPFVKVAQPPGAPDVLYVTGDLDLAPAVYASVDDGVSFAGRRDLGEEATLPMSLSVDPDQPLHLWLGTYSELLESHDGGLTWRNITRNIHQSCGTGLAVAEEDDETALYVGLLDHSGLLARRNAFRRAGGVWRELPVPSDVFALARIGPKHVVAGTLFQGAFVSVDGGTSFDAARGIPREDFSVLSLHASSGGIVLAGGAGTSGATTYRSTDGGRTFQPVDLPAPALPNDFAERGGVIVAVGEGGVARSTDAGASWQVRFRTDDDLRSVAILDDSGDVLLVGDARGQLRRSEDGGLTFAPLFAGFVGRAEVNRLLVDPRDGSVLAGLASANVFVRSLVRESGLWRSRDGGATFEPVARARPSSHIYEMMWDPRQPGRLYAAMWCSGVQVIDVP